MFKNKISIKTFLKLQRWMKAAVGLQKCICPCLDFAALFEDELLKQEQEQEQARLNEARKISVVNVNPTNIRPHSDTPEIRKYKKRFNSEILCAALWGETMTLAAEAYASEVFSVPLLFLWMWEKSTVCLFPFYRGESAGGDGERPDAAGPKRPGESLQPD